jgi:CheY-like chemotaxis protein
MEEMGRMLERLLPENIEVKVAFEGGVGLVTADPGAIEQVVLNLATNARDAMPKGGRLHIEVGRQRLDGAYRSTHPWVNPGRYACICVSDTGTGMDEATLGKIFDPFFTTKPADEGTGLGMSMVYGLVKQHGGFVHVYSEMDQGTTVKLYLPEAEISTRADRRCVSFESEALTGSATVVVAEDDAALRRAAKRVLENQGYTVLAAADGEEALSILTEHGPDVGLVISDLVMPKLDGADLLEAVKQGWPHVRFLLTSGFSGNEVQERTAIGSDVLVLQKPWTVTEFLWSVYDALAGEDSERKSGSDEAEGQGRLSMAVGGTPRMVGEWSKE